MAFFPLYFIMDSGYTNEVSVYKLYLLGATFRQELTSPSRLRRATSPTEGRPWHTGKPRLFARGSPTRGAGEELATRLRGCTKDSLSVSRRRNRTSPSRLRRATSPTEGRPWHTGKPRLFARGSPTRGNGDDRRQRRKQGGAVGAAASRMQATAKQTLGAATRPWRAERDGEGKAAARELLPEMLPKD